MSYWRASGPAISYNRGEGLAVYYRVDSGDAHLLQSGVLQLLEALAASPRAVEELAGAGGVTPEEVLPLLEDLEAAGLVVRV